MELRTVESIAMLNIPLVGDGGLICNVDNAANDKEYVITFKRKSA